MPFRGNFFLGTQSLLAHRTEKHMEARIILDILYYERRFFLLIFLAIFLPVMLITASITPSWDSTAKLYLRIPSTSTRLQAATGGLTVSPMTITTMDVGNFPVLAMSRPVIEEVIDKLQLKRERTRSIVIRSIPLLRPILSMLGVDVNDTHARLSFDDIQTPPLTSLFFPIPKMSVVSESDTTVIDITVQSPIPEQAVEIVNVWAKVLIDLEYERIIDDRRRARQQVEARMTDIRQTVLNTFEKFAEFRKAESLFNQETQVSTLLARESQIRTLMDDAEVSYQKSQRIVTTLNDKLANMSKYQLTSKTIQVNPDVAKIKGELVDFYIERSRLERRYTEEHPSLADLNKKIAAAEAWLKKSIERTLSDESFHLDTVTEGLRQDLVTNEINLAIYDVLRQAYAKVLDSYRQDLQKIASTSARMTPQDIDYSVSQDIYRNLQSLHQQLTLWESVAESFITLVEPGGLPDLTRSNHRHPSWSFNTVLAIFMGSFFALWGVIFRHYIRETFVFPDELDQMEFPPLLGIIPLEKENMNLSPAHPLSCTDEVRSLRDQIRYVTRGGTVRSLAVISPSVGSGKSHLTAELGIAMTTRRDYRVLLIDAHMQSPALHTFFNQTPAMGLVELLQSQEDLAHMLPRLYQEVRPGLLLLQAGKPCSPSQVSSLLDGTRLIELLDLVREEVDMVLIDTPPQRHNSNALLLAEYAGHALIVVESRRTLRKAFAGLMVQTRRAEVQVIGTVMNRFSEIPLVDFTSVRPVLEKLKSTFFPTPSR